MLSQHLLKSPTGLPAFPVNAINLAGQSVGARPLFFLVATVNSQCVFDLWDRGTPQPQVFPVGSLSPCLVPFIKTDLGQPQQRMPGIRFKFQDPLEAGSGFIITFHERKGSSHLYVSVQASSSARCDFQ